MLSPPGNSFLCGGPHPRQWPTADHTRLDISKSATNCQPVSHQSIHETTDFNTAQPIALCYPHHPLHYNNLCTVDSWSSPSPGLNHAPAHSYAESSRSPLPCPRASGGTPGPCTLPLPAVSRVPSHGPTVPARGTMRAPTLRRCRAALPGGEPESGLETPTCD